MKQHITKEQWDELDKKQKAIFSVSLNLPMSRKEEYFGNTDFRENERYPNIGQMIEFLGDDLVDIEWDYSPRDVDVNLHWKRFKHYNLCDALWEAVKQKLI